MRKKLLYLKKKYDITKKEVLHIPEGGKKKGMTSTNMKAS